MMDGIDGLVLGDCLVSQTCSPMVASSDMDMFICW